MSVARALLRTFGELAITLGFLILAFVGWQLWWTDIVAGAAQAQAVTAIEQDFAALADEGPAIPADEDSVSVTPAQVDPRLHPPAPVGDAFALIRVPRFGRDFVRPVREGTTADILADGVGHYVGTAAPGDLGNFAIAGHRTTYGKPFSDIDALLAGDSIVIETRTGYHVYAVTSHDIVLPSAVEVLEPVPGQPGAAASEAVLTLTSCHPRYSAAERYVVHAVLTGSYSRDAGLPESVLASPTGD